MKRGSFWRSARGCGRREKRKEEEEEEEEEEGRLQRH
jgi:hypothetical protein